MSLAATAVQPKTITDEAFAFRSASFGAGNLGGPTTSESHTLP